MSFSMPSDDSKIVNYLVRMVVPLRREFGQHLDVQHFLHDLDYAQEVLKKALSSQDPRLREQAEYVSKLKFGPRVGDAQPTIKAPAPATPAGMVERRKTRRDAPNGQRPDAPATRPPDTPLSAEEEMKARIMKKYTSGLR
jgi:hypothetical protein